MAIKIDLHKAYDKLRWEFIEDSLRDVGFPEEFIKITMFCVSSASMQVLWNGIPSEKFQASRGIRQRDLSPCLMHRTPGPCNTRPNK